MTKNFDGVKSAVNIDGIEVETYKQEFGDINIIEVEAGTTGPQGGDSGHGCRTYMRIENLSSTDMRPTGYSDNYGNSDFSVIFGGDSELETFIDALEFTLDTLKMQLGYQSPKTEKERRRIDFNRYIGEIVELYNRTGKLSGMSEIKKQYRITAITKEQFFKCHLDDVGDDTYLLDRNYTDKVYDYILDKKNAQPAPIFKK